MKTSITSLERCDFSQAPHRQAFCSLLRHYMEDPMGDYTPHTEAQENKLIEDLATHPTAAVYLMKLDGVYVGLATTFMNYSTFKRQPYLYLHDVVIHHAVRGKGLGKKMVSGLIDIARAAGCCKVSLEVRSDNPAAQTAYKALGFDTCDPAMLYWEKSL